jgi:hypothetical protein
MAKAKLNLPSLTQQHIDRFWSHVAKAGPEDCWLWTAASLGGYGVWSFQLNGEKFTIGAHRLSWMLRFGEIPGGLWVLHNCPGGDNRLCVNPAHLWLGTHADNMADMASKGRAACGDRNGSRMYPERVTRGDRHWTRLRPERVLRGDQNGSRLHPESRPRGDNHWARTRPELLPRGSAHGRATLTEEQVVALREAHAAGANVAELARRFGITKSTATDAARGKTWRHI